LGARSLTRADVLSTTEVAELLGIPRSTVHHLARRGQLAARRAGRRWLFLRDRLAAAIAPLTIRRRGAQKTCIQGRKRYSTALLHAGWTTQQTVAQTEKAALYRAFVYGSDGTRTRDLRRDRPAL
jgi:excisionase family DNA binding protein